MTFAKNKLSFDFLLINLKKITLIISAEDKQDPKCAAPDICDKYKTSFLT